MESNCEVVVIDKKLYERLEYLGIIPNDVNKRNEGTSNYNCGKFIITPWVIWLDHPELDEFDKDIIKRVIRIKDGDPRELDYKKIKHICDEKIRQIRYKETHPYISEIYKDKQ